MIGEVACSVAFAYNRRVSRIAIIQELRMILNAIRKGVSEVGEPRLRTY